MQLDSVSPYVRAPQFRRMGPSLRKFHIQRKVHNSFLGQTSTCDTAPFVGSPTLIQPAVSLGQIVSNSEVSQVFASSLPIRISIGALPARLPRTKRRWLCTYANRSNIGCATCPRHVSSSGRKAELTFSISDELLTSVSRASTISFRIASETSGKKIAA